MKEIYRYTLIRQHKKRRKQRHSLRRRLFKGWVSIDQRPKGLTLLNIVTFYYMGNI